MSAEPSETSAPWMTPTLAIGLAVVSALSLVAFLVLSAFAPQLRPDSTGGANALSRSGVGFAGLRILLAESGVPVTIDRGPSTGQRDPNRLTIVTPEWLTAPSELAALVRSRPSLIVLPKWLTTSDPLHSGWAMKIDKFDEEQLAKLLSTLSKTTKIVRLKSSAKVGLDWAENAARPNAQPLAPLTIESLQTLAGKDWAPIITTAKGQIVVAQLVHSDIYVVADPDLLDTQGLRTRDGAHVAFNLVDGLRLGWPIAFDVTLNGFRNSPDLLREAFSPPFLGATLCALLAAVLMGYHAVFRFGAPLAPERVHAYGKRALADSTAGLIRMLGREPLMAPRYAQTMRNLVLKSLGTTPRETARPDDWLLRAEARARPDTTFAALLAEAQSARTPRALMVVAKALYRWRQRIMHEPR